MIVLLDSCLVESRLSVGLCNRVTAAVANAIAADIGNESVIKVWIIDIHDLPPINETLDERIEVAQVILEVFDICL